MSAEGPRWALVRAAVPLPGLPRGERATVDLHDPYVKRMLAAQYLVPLPAAEQPMLRHDPESNGPALREGSDAA